MADDDDPNGDVIRAAMGQAMERQMSAKLRAAANEYLMTFGPAMAMHEFSTLLVPTVLAMAGDDDDKAKAAAAYGFSVALRMFDSQLDELVSDAMKDGMEVPKDMLARLTRIKTQKGERADG